MKKSQSLTVTITFLVSDGSYQCFNIEVWLANSLWVPERELTSTNHLGFGDFYVYTFPTVIPNSAIICGYFSNSSEDQSNGFIMEFNVSTDTFTLCTDVAGAGYVTQILYISSLNEFAITANGNFINNVMISTPANLFTPHKWVPEGPYVDPNISWNEHMITCDSATEYIYLLHWDEATGNSLSQINATTWIATEIWNTGIGTYKTLAL